MSPNGAGLSWINLATSSFAVGVTGASDSPAGVGINGVNTDASGGTGVLGTSNATSGQGSSVAGVSASPNGVGVVGSPAVGWLVAWGGRVDQRKTHRIQ